MSLDVVVFAVIALVVLYRLYLTLGDRTGFDPTDLANKKDQSQSSPKKSASIFDIVIQKDNDFNKFDPYIRANMMSIVKLDPKFDSDEFVQGATIAYEMILNAYAQGNLDDLKNLLAPDLFAAFKSDIQTRQSQKQTYENSLVKLDQATIVDAKLKGDTALITVKFVSEQIPVLKDHSGYVIQGNPDQIDQVIDHWIFERSLKSTNLNWIVTEMDA